MQCKSIAAPHTPTSFVAVDVETASRRCGDICQVGVASFQGGELTRVLSFLIRPPVPITLENSRVHGLTDDHVRSAPLWEEAYGQIARELHGRCIVSHTFFDRREIFAACCRSKCTMFSYRSWLDTCGISRRAWPDLPSYKLSALAHRLGLSYSPHDAAEDARIAGEVLLAQKTH